MADKFNITDFIEALVEKGPIADNEFTFVDAPDTAYVANQVRVTKKDENFIAPVRASAQWADIKNGKLYTAHRVFIGMGQGDYEYRKTEVYNALGETFAELIKAINEGGAELKANGISLSSISKLRPCKTFPLREVVMAGFVIAFCEDADFGSGADLWGGENTEQHIHDSIANWLWDDGGCMLWDDGSVIAL